MNTDLRYINNSGTQMLLAQINFGYTQTTGTRKLQVYTNFRYTNTSSIHRLQVHTVFRYATTLCTNIQTSGTYMQTSVTHRL